MSGSSAPKKNRPARPKVQPGLKTAPPPPGPVTDVQIPPITRHNEGVLAVACVMLFVGAWIDKGLGLISAGFVPNPLHEVNEYMPSCPEVMITIGVYAIGALVLTVLYKMAVGVKEEVRA